MTDEYNDEEKDDNPENEKGTFEYWKRLIPAMKKGAEIHWRDSELTWNEYECKSTWATNHSNSINVIESGSRIWWSSCKILENALYGLTPKTITYREFGVNDGPALAACKIAEGLGKHHTGTCRVTSSRFDEAMMSAVQNYIQTDKASLQIIYEKQMMDERIPLQGMPNRETGEMEYYKEDSSFYEGETIQVDGQTFGFTGEQVVDPKSQRIYPVNVLYNQTLHSPEAANQYDITEKAQYFFLSKAEAEKRFGEDKCKEIKWKSRTEGTTKTDEQLETDDYIGEFLEGWECYDIENRMVRWYSDQCNEFLDEKKDPDRYYDFWPTTDYIIGSKPSKTLYPTPVHTQLKPLIGQLHLLSERIYDLVDAIRPRALVDGNEEVVALLDSVGTNMFIACSGLQSIIEKGGLKNMVLFVPVKELVDALNTSIAVQQQFKAEFNELFGIPDVLRGITDPLEAEGTNAQNLQAASDRFKYSKKQIATLASQAILKMIEMSVQVYSPEKIAGIVGMKFWESDALKQSFTEGLEILKDPEQSVVRIDIDTDSLTFKDEKREQARRRYVSDLVMSTLREVPSMLQVDPSYASVALKLLTDTLEKTGEGKFLSDDCNAAVDALIKKSQEPPPPPPPDPVMERLNFDREVHQWTMEKDRGELQLKSQSNQQKEMKTELDAVKLQVNAALEDRAQQLEAALESRRLEQDDFKIQLTAQKQQAEAMVSQFMMQIEAVTLELKKMQTQGEQWERQMEEFRLAKQVDQEIPIAAINASAAASQSQETAPEAPAPPVINIVSPQISPSNINLPAAEPEPVMPVDPLAAILGEDEF